MLTLLTVLLLPQDEPTAKQVVERMLARYYEAERVQARITTVQTAASARVTTVTDLWVKRPAQILIRQSRDGSEGGKWLAVSDGKRFAYDRPANIIGKPRFLEEAVENGKPMDVRDVYSVVSLGLGDPNPPLTILVSSRRELSGLARGQWVNDWQLAQGDAGANYVLSGSLRTLPNAPANARVTLTVSPAYDLLGYEIRERIGVPNAAPVEVVTVHTIESTLGGEIADTLFDPLQRKG